MDLKFIDEEAEKLDISAFPSKAAELHRLFDNARDSIVALLVFTRKAGVMIEEDQFLPIALNSMVRNKNGKRSVQTWWNGRLVSIDVDSLDTANASRLALAEQYGVSEQVFLRYEKRIADQCGTYVQVSCNHCECSMTKGIGFDTPTAMLEAEHRAATEIWYCHHHRETAFEQDMALSDELLPVLERIGHSSGITQKETGATLNDIRFLASIGLVTVDKDQISLTGTGRAMLDQANWPARL